MLDVCFKDLFVIIIEPQVGQYLVEDDELFAL